MRPYDEKVDSILKFTAENAEFVVEKGTFTNVLHDNTHFYTSGEYTKYSSGRIVVDANRRVSSAPDGQIGQSSIYYKTLTADLPTQIKNIKSVNCEIGWGTGLYWASVRERISGTAPAVALNFFANQGGTMNLDIYIHAEGTWK